VYVDSIISHTFSMERSMEGLDILCRGYLSLQQPSSTPLVRVTPYGLYLVGYRSQDPLESS
jgi:hypothetical protein